MRISSNEKVATKILDLIHHWDLDELQIGKYIARVASRNAFTKFQMVANSAILERNEIEGVENLDNISEQN